MSNDTITVDKIIENQYEQYHRVEPECSTKKRTVGVGRVAWAEVFAAEGDMQVLSMASANCCQQRG